MSKNIGYSFYDQLFEISHRNENSCIMMPPHTHNGVEIYLSITEIPHVLIDTKVLSIPKNTLIIFPPYCIHQLTAKTDEVCERYVFTVNTSWLNKLSINISAKYAYLEDGKHPIVIPLDDIATEILTGSFEELITCDSENIFLRFSYFFKCMTIIDNIVLSAEEYINTSKIEKSAISKNTVNEIIEYINSHIDKSITLKELSAHFFLNPNYISRIFKKHTNTTISNYIAMQKIGIACQLLTAGSTVTEAQIKSGYSSYTYFFRAFKKLIGISPKEFRDLYYTAD